MHYAEILNSIFKIRVVSAPCHIPSMLLLSVFSQVTHFMFVCFVYKISLVFSLKRTVFNSIKTEEYKFD